MEWIKTDYYVLIDKLDGKPFFAKIVGSEPIRRNISLTAVAANSTGTIEGQEDLEPRVEKRFYQLRFGLRQKMRAYFELPLGVKRLGVDKSVSTGYIDSDTNPIEATEFNELFELFTFYRVRPGIKVENILPLAITPNIKVIGKAYDFEVVPEGSSVWKALKNKQIPFIPIVIGINRNAGR